MVNILGPSSLQHVILVAQQNPERYGWERVVLEFHHHVVKLQEHFQQTEQKGTVVHAYNILASIKHLLGSM